MRARAATAVVIAVVVAVGAGALLAWRFNRAAAPAESPSVLRTAASGPPSVAPRPARAGSSSASSVATAVPAVPEGWVEVCGEQPVKISRLDDDPRLRSTAPLKQISDSLRASSDTRQRAVGLTLAVANRLFASIQGISSREQACSGDVACLKELERSLGSFRLTGQGPELDELAQLAATSTDPALYGLATQVCHANDRLFASACRQLSLAEWARREPDNLAPWLYLADASPANSPARAEALHRASLAVRHEDAVALWVEAALAPYRRGLSPWDELALEVQFFSLWSTQALAPVHAASAHCEPKSLADPNRLQLCDALAGSLVDHGNNLLVLSIGAAIGQRLGWPSEKVKAVRNFVAMGQSILAGTGTIETSLSCSGRAAMRRYTHEVATLGEVGAIRAAIARATPEHLATARTAAQADWDRRVASATAVASSAPLPSPPASATDHPAQPKPAPAAP